MMLVKHNPIGTSIALIVCTALISAGCQSNKLEAPAWVPTQLTHGQVQLKIVIGVTTKNAILEAFGAPNIVTTDGSGQDVWSYQRAATIVQQSAESGYGTIVVAGFSSQASSAVTSSRMHTMIIRFRADGVVADFKSRSSNF
jgi:hypothetical protein